MPKSRLCAAALLGLALIVPGATWSQASKAPPGPVMAAAWFDHAKQLERAGQWDKALEAYQEAAAAGHGPALKRLGDIYNNGSGEVQRDYETSLRWHQRAREQGENIPQPFSYPGVRR